MLADFSFSSLWTSSLFSSYRILFISSFLSTSFQKFQKFQFDKVPIRFQKVPKFGNECEMDRLKFCQLCEWSTQCADDLIKHMYYHHRYGPRSFYVLNCPVNWCNVQCNGVANLLGHFSYHYIGCDKCAKVDCSCIRGNYMQNS